MPALPQQMWDLAGSFTVKPARVSNCLGSAVISCPCWSEQRSGRRRSGLASRALASELLQHLGDVHGEGGDLRGGLASGSSRNMKPWSLMVVLVEAFTTMASSPSPAISSTPGGDIGAGGSHRRVMLAHVMRQRAAAALAGGDHHLDPHAGQQADGRLVDPGVQHLLGAAR